MNTTCLKIQFNSKQTQTAALVEIKAFLLWLRESFLDVLSSVFFKQAVLYWKKSESQHRKTNRRSTSLSFVDLQGYSVLCFQAIQH